MVMELDIFVFFTVVVIGQNAKSVSSFGIQFFIFCIVFQPLPSGRKKLIFAKHAKFYQHLCLDFSCKQCKKKVRNHLKHL